MMTLLRTARLRALLLLSFCTVLTASTRVRSADFETTGPARRVLAGDYEKKRIGLVDAKGHLEWEIPLRDIHDLWVLPNGNLLLQTNWTRVLELSPKREVVWSYDSATANGNAGKPVEVHAFQRLPNGRTMIAESGPGRIIEVDRKGRIRHEIKLKLDKPNPHRDTRLVRKLSTGNYLVAHEGDAKVREYDRKGNVVWEYTVGNAVYSVSRLKNGNTLIGCGDGHRVIEVNARGEKVWSVEQDEIPGVRLAWVTMTERLPNGNTVIVNCHAGPTQPQIVEVTPQKKVAWSFKDFRNFGNALPAARVLQK